MAVYTDVISGVALTSFGTVNEVAGGLFDDDQIALQLDGTTGYLTGGANDFRFLGTEPFSIFGLVILDSVPTSGFRRLLSKEITVDIGTGAKKQGYDAVMQNSTGRLFFERWVEGAAGTHATGILLSTTEWVHFGFTFTGSQVKAYQNRKLISTGGAAGSMNYGASPPVFTVGRVSGSSSGYFPGRFCGLGIVVGAALSDAEMSEIGDVALNGPVRPHLMMAGAGR